MKRTFAYSYTSIRRIYRLMKYAWNSLNTSNPPCNQGIILPPTSIGWAIGSSGKNRPGYLAQHGHLPPGWNIVFRFAWSTAWNPGHIYYPNISTPGGMVITYPLEETLRLAKKIFYGFNEVYSLIARSIPVSSGGDGWNDTTGSKGSLRNQTTPHVRFEAGPLFPRQVLQHDLKP